MRRGSNGGEARWSALAALPDFGTRVPSASVVVAYVAVGAAATLSTSVVPEPVRTQPFASRMRNEANATKLRALRTA